MAMDDGDVHQQLHALKDRVNALTLRYSPGRSPAVPASSSQPPPSGDAVMAQLRDVKAHLSSMQQSYAFYQQRMRQQAAQQQNGVSADNLTSQSFMSLPSGPLFWQLFNSLRSDFQSLDTRVAGLEQDVDALEDRLDRLEPDRFTPPGSTTSQEDGGVHISLKPTRDDLDATATCLPELSSEGSNCYPEPEPGQCHSRISSVQSQRPGWYCNTASNNGPWPTFAASNYGPWPTFAQQQYTGYQPYGYSVPNLGTVHPEGVAFRDREIDRMDDQLKSVQESLQSSEALAAAQDTTLSNMKAQIETLQNRNDAISFQLLQCSHTREELEAMNRQFEEKAERTGEELRSLREEHEQAISEHNMTIRYWQDRCESEAAALRNLIAERDRAIQLWEESHNAATDAWQQEKQRAASVSARLDHYFAHRRDELDRIHFGYNREMEKLKEFCEQKDAVIVEQEHVMSRGARLLEDRDTEIDRLQKRLRVVEDDAQHEVRQQKRMARLLDETQGELARWRQPSESNEARAQANVGEEKQDAVMAASTGAIDGREPLEIPGSYPREGRRVNGTRQRRSADPEESGGSEKEAARTGSPRRRRVRRHESARHLPPSQRAPSPRRLVRRSSPPPRPHHWPDRQTQRGRFVGDREGMPPPQSGERRRARFLDDAIDPPLPAPVTARKMASEADLRRADGYAGKVPVRHQSMQDLPGLRQHLQATVETEGESDAEKEGGLQQGYV